MVMQALPEVGVVPRQERRAGEGTRGQEEEEAGIAGGDEELGEADPDPRQDRRRHQDVEVEPAADEDGEGDRLEHPGLRLAERDIRTRKGTPQLSTGTR